MPSSRIHPSVRKSEQALKSGRMDRRDFLRIASLLGLSWGLASVLAGMPSPAGAQDSRLPFPPADPKAKTGGILRAAMNVGALRDPALFETVEMSNQTRHMLEYLAMTGTDNITRPMLAQSWSASNDLKTWDIVLREGILWHNGDELVADHVVWNIRRWLDPRLGADGLTGLATFAAMRTDRGGVAVETPGAVETVDRYALRLTLNAPVLSVMEDFFHYPAAICHPSFAAPLSTDSIGTGPFRIAEMVEGEVCILTRVRQTGDGRPFEYWGGEVYLDEIHYYHAAPGDGLAAYGAGDVDFVHEIGRGQIAEAKALDATVHPGRTARTLVCRMQTSQAPFDDIRIRQAVVKSVDNGAVKAKIFPEGGDVAENYHVAPIHPDYFKLPAPARDIEGARKLLEDAGHPFGLDLSILVADVEDGWQVAVCEVLREQMGEAGIRLSLTVLPGDDFRDLSAKAAFAAIFWPHLPLGTMALSQAYRTGAPRNDTHFADPGFDEALDLAESTLDMDRRRARMQKVERILQDSYLMVQPLHCPIYAAASTRIRGFSTHPVQCHQFNRVWID